MMNTVAGKSRFYTRDGGILLHLFYRERGVVPMMQSEMLPIVSVWLSWKMVEEMEDVYNRMIDDRNALRDATAALTSAPLPNEPAADEEETV